ncbi:MAG TPA: YtxH domain-containing protein [Nitrospiraceae bacterium]|nr:YtxH domain-containing protein [Nitrospiraceae bacterium]
MEENSTSSVKTITLLFIGGAMLGAVAGVLFAPKSGKETRKEFKHYAMKVKKDVAVTAQRTKAGIEAAFEKGRALLAEPKAA